MKTYVNTFACKKIFCGAWGIWPMHTHLKTDKDPYTHRLKQSYTHITSLHQVQSSNML